MISVAGPSWLGGGANTITFPAHPPPQKFPVVSSKETKHPSVALVHGPTGTEAIPMVLSEAVACCPVAVPHGVDVHVPATPVTSKPEETAPPMPELEASSV